MTRIKVVYFKDCPNAAMAKHAIEASCSEEYEEVIQDDLDPSDPNLAFSSPTILVDDQIVFGGRQDGIRGCSIGRIDPELIKERLISARILTLDHNSFSPKGPSRK